MMACAPATKPQPADGYTSASIAREAAGLTPEQAAKRARITPEYLRHVERHGAPFSLAQRLVRLYGGDARLDIFLRTKPKRSARSEQTRESSIPSRRRHIARTLTRNDEGGSPRQ